MSSNIHTGSNFTVRHHSSLDRRILAALMCVLCIALHGAGAMAAPTFGPKTDFMTGSFPTSVAIGDLNRDGKLDLAVADQGINMVSVLLGNGNGTFGPKTDFATGGTPWPVAIGDVNRDGKPDLAVANYSSNSFSILLGNGDGTFGPKTDTPSVNAPETIALGDLNRDGKLDVVIVG